MDYRSSLFFSVTLGFLAPSAAALLEYIKRRISEIISSPTPPKPKKPAFKLLKLPWVALKEVLRPMEHRDVFMLSLCSKKTFNILKTCKTKVNWLYYIGGDRNLSVYSLQNNYHRDSIFSMRYTYDNSYWVENEQNLIRLTVGGMDVQCLWKGDGIEYYYTTNSEALQQALDNHIHQLFTAKYIDLEVSKKTFSDVHYPNISKVTDLWISHNLIVRPSQLEDVLEKYPNLKSFRMDGCFSGQIPAYPKLLNIEHVFIDSHYYYRASYLRKNFKGRYLNISGARFHTNHILNFVKNWISGKKYFNLDVFLMSNFDKYLIIEWILDELNDLGKQWDRPTVYEYWSRATGRTRREKIDLSGNEYQAFIDFERKTDQKMATLMLSDHKFGFIVWN